ncbi:MAG TPA: hypothetical protein VFX98_16810 [Longimicrobiaceae bacterium]|nr:hypothetical protein [Longimicrobiaceae bacterium]
MTRRPHLLSALVVLGFWALAAGSGEIGSVKDPYEEDTTFHPEDPPPERGVPDPPAGAAQADSLARRWQVRRDTSLMEDTPGVELTVDASGNGLTLDPRSLTVECRDNRTAIFVDTDARLRPRGQPRRDELPVRVRFDDAPAEAQRWTVSRDDEVLFAPGAVALARRLAAVRVFRIEYTTAIGSLIVLRFDVRGLGRHLGEVADACGWEYTPPAEASR